MTFDLLPVHRHRAAFATALSAACLVAATCAHAQQVQALSLQGVPPDLIHPQELPAELPAQASNASQGLQPIDLGQNLGADAMGAAPPAASWNATAAYGPAMQAAQQARVARHVRRPPATGAARRAGVERAVFERQPVRVPLPVGHERLITLPAPAALHVPSDMQQVARIEVIDRTLYVTALMPFTPIRIVAELIDSGQQIPMDLVAGEQAGSSDAELEVFVVAQGPAAAEDGQEQAKQETAEPSASQDADMVELTRHAARMLYAPRRLAWSLPGVRQVPVSSKRIDGLLRGARVEAVPLGQWRSGQLHVTAVRITNLSRQPLELPLEDVRGRWIAAAAQHGRIGAAGSDTDTTALYLVCDRAFEACLD